MKKSIYGMNNSGKLFGDELTNWLIYEAGFKQSQYQMTIYYKYAPDGSKTDSRRHYTLKSNLVPNQCIGPATAGGLTLNLADDHL